MTYTPPTVAGPATNPWDTADIAAQALGVLRLDPSDMDAERIATKAQEATGLIDEHLDMVDPYATTAAIPEWLVGAAVTLTVEMYRRKDSFGGVVDSWSADGAYFRLAADVLKGVRSQIHPGKQRWGMA